MKPIIVISFDYDEVKWKSAGWGSDAKLMKKAKQAINRGETPGEVVDLLRKAGFMVVEEVETGKED